ncbi:MAG TPA: bifunctional precorrin-2 dehydrogenase/sirohydrochlorin ferrochelatase [Dissulfurispiraceae bacterium]|nr:bifunctional precorrin-2 dehydrogenase/sirohydrochlorin ferrochelatase [Dissulfurispiraceae bacterium]
MLGRSPADGRGSGRTRHRLSYYPAFLDLTDKPCVVVGGGPVAERKIGTLLAAGGSVTVISPGITAGLLRLSACGKIRHRNRAYRSGDLQGAFLVVAATGSREVNARVAKEAPGLVNVADSPAAGNFIVPAAAQSGPLMFAISTGGASPALAKTISAELKKHYPASIGRYSRFLGRLRRRILGTIPSGRQRERFFREAASRELLEIVRRDGERAGTARVRIILKNYERGDK